ncbi:MAG: DPP IV N-terminal domain-containing protein [Bacteroidia bacterium]|nr:DPP IV N-terminal domain-containing protein [Bacteroidia bacterium]
MRKVCLAIASMFLSFALAGAQEFNRIPTAWKWISPTEAAFSFDGSFTDAKAFSVNAKKHSVTEAIKAPEKYTELPLHPEGAVNLTYSPDSTMLAYTRDNNLWVVDIETGNERPLTYDGTDLILNGYASWVYYEEILGRPSLYRAFWWSPDSKKIGFYRFDNSEVPMFPIYSPFGQDGRLNLTRYPKAGETNPQVRIGIIDVDSMETVWADFDEKEDQYFGIPFWGADSEGFFVAREPRLQHELDLYCVSAKDGSKQHIYHEEYKTWLDWPEEMQFTENGLYMVRAFETGWEQIYFLSYDGKTFKRLTDGENWRTSIIRVDEKAGDVYFTSNRDATASAALYKVDKKGVITALTDPQFNVTGVTFSPDGKYFVAALSNFTTPNRIMLCETAKANTAKGCFKVADMQGPDYDASKYALAKMVHITTDDGLQIPAAITYPVDFDPAKKYPVHMEIYGGPNTAYVRDRWVTPNSSNQWWSDNGIITITADSRVAGHNGRIGTDQDFRNLTATPVKDFVAWADWLQSLPYVIPEKIGVEGFSFGGTMTTLLLLEHSDKFHYGIAGGGVYDWMLYDSHYTERFMETPQANPDGYAASRVISSVPSYPVTYDNNDGSVMLKITHGTGDDNVHFQNTLQLVDEMQKQGKCFNLMIYPDGMHGYRGLQGQHDEADDRAFWLKYLKGE